MKQPPDFRHEDTFLQTTKKAALGMIQLPYIAEDIREMLSHSMELLYLIFGGIFRMLMLVLMPISAPLAAYMIRKDMDRRKKASEDMKRWRYVQHAADGGAVVE